MKMLRTVFLVVMLILPLAAGQAAAYAESPTQAIKRTHSSINRLLRKKVKAGSTQDKQVKDKVKKVVNTFLDFEELAKRSLGKHWDVRTEQEQAEFVSVLKDLIERNYIKQLRSNLGYKLEYRDESVDGQSAKVVTVVKVVKKGRTTEITIEYKMRKVSGGWMVFDVITDDVSIVRNYRSQFNRIIKRDSYEVLIKKMRNKLKETT